MTEDDPKIFTLLLVLSALALSLSVLAQIATSYFQAYVDAPTEIVLFLDAVDFSIQENESYDRDVAKVQRLEDKLRLGKLLREIQKGGDDLREVLNSCVVGETGTKLKSSVRLLWASRKKTLEERMRRLDMLRLRFLVVYMGVVAVHTPQLPSPAVPQTPPMSPLSDPGTRISSAPERPGLPRGLTEAIAKRANGRELPLRRLNTQTMGHIDNVGGGHRGGWAGVVQELQKSPLMQKRHASIESAMSSPRGRRDSSSAGNGFS